jgi:hemoglobin/transferrin/lactoferrin receptor protein
MQNNSIMRIFIVMVWTALQCIPAIGFTQTEEKRDSTARELEPVVVSFNKWEQKLNEVPNKIQKVDMRDVRLRNPQTTADLLAQQGGVFIQKSQQGGGSPMIRGFATNRVLIVADGIRMNNAIYRSGNIQNVISIDALALDDAEVIFGPGSLIYGSDAIGGVMDFHTLSARYARDKKLLARGSALARYSTANQEKTFHADLNLGGKRWSLLASASHNSFGDPKMGIHGGQDSYLRPEYVERVDGVDSIFRNPDPRVQRFNDYEQLNLLAKARFRASEFLDLQYSFTLGQTGDAPRYDRLIQYRQGELRFAEWYYGPMIWRMHALQVTNNRKSALYDESRITLAFQDYDESRNDRTRGNNNRNTQSEKVRAYTANWDMISKGNRTEWYYGAELVYNKVGSTGYRKDILTGDFSPFASRYPDGSTWFMGGMYASNKFKLHERLTLSSGLRYSYGMLDAAFDTTVVKFPYREANIHDGALTGNAGLVYRPDESWQMNVNLSTGFRMPNIDDVGKLFESAPGNITVPNPDLQAEYAWNAELGLVKSVLKKWRVELNAFYTLLDNAIVRRPGSFNSEDSILFDGVLSRVESLQNASRANVWGFQAGMEIILLRNLVLQANANWIQGTETDDVRDEQVPLRHAPPFYGNANLRYKSGKWFVEWSAFFNAAVRNEDLAPSEQAKTDIYAKDANGNPYSPSWYTVNLKASYQLTRNLSLNAGWENMTNQRYRPYSSGVVAPGTNFIFSLRATL